MSEETNDMQTDTQTEVQPVDSAPKEPEEMQQPEQKANVIGIEQLRSGMTIRIHERIKDVTPKGEERERIQIFQGIIIGLHGGGVSRTMSIRRVQKGYGAEKIYPLHSPIIAKIEVVKTAKVRRAKLGFLRDLRHRFKRKFKETWTETTKKK